MSKKENWAEYVDKHVDVEKKKAEKKMWATLQELRQISVSGAMIAAYAGIPVETTIASIQNSARVSLQVFEDKELAARAVYLVESWIRGGYEKVAKNGSV